MKLITVASALVLLVAGCGEGGGEPPAAIRVAEPEIAPGDTCSVPAEIADAIKSKRYVGAAWAYDGGKGRGDGIIYEITINGRQHDIPACAYNAVQRLRGQ